MECKVEHFILNYKYLIFLCPNVRNYPEVAYLCKVV